MEAPRLAHRILHHFHEGHVAMSSERLVIHALELLDARGETAVKDSPGFVPSTDGSPRPDG